MYIHSNHENILLKYDSLKPILWSFALLFLCDHTQFTLHSKKWKIMTYNSFEADFQNISHNVFRIFENYHIYISNLMFIMFIMLPLVSMRTDLLFIKTSGQNYCFGSICNPIQWDIHWMCNRWHGTGRCNSVLL